MLADRSCERCGAVVTSRGPAKRFCSSACYNSTRADAARALRSNRQGRLMAARLYSLDGVTCEHDDCDAPAVERHHIDGDTWRNERTNIALLCRFHHMEIDGRLRAQKSSKLAEADVVAIRASSLNYAALAEQFGVSESNIRLIRKGHTWASVPGEIEGRCPPKVTPEQVREIRASDLSTTELMLRYAISQSHVKGIRAGRSWRNVA